MIKPGDNQYNKMYEAVVNRHYGVLCASHGYEIYLYDDGTLRCMKCSKEELQEEDNISSTWTREQIIDLIDKYFRETMEVNVELIGGYES